MIDSSSKRFFRYGGFLSPFIEDPIIFHYVHDVYIPQKPKTTNNNYELTYLGPNVRLFEFDDETIYTRGEATIMEDMFLDFFMIGGDESRSKRKARRKVVSFQIGKEDNESDNFMLTGKFVLQIGICRRRQYNRRGVNTRRVAYSYKPKSSQRRW